MIPWDARKVESSSSCVMRVTALSNGTWTLLVKSLSLNTTSASWYRYNQRGGWEEEEEEEEAPLGSSYGGGDWEEEEEEEAPLTVKKKRNGRGARILAKDPS